MDVSNFTFDYFFLFGSVDTRLTRDALQYAKIGSDLKALNSTSWIATA